MGRRRGKVFLKREWKEEMGKKSFVNGSRWRVKGVREDGGNREELRYVYIVYPSAPHPLGSTQEALNSAICIQHGAYYSSISQLILPWQRFQDQREPLVTCLLFSCRYPPRQTRARPTFKVYRWVSDFALAFDLSWWDIQFIMATCYIPDESKRILQVAKNYENKQYALKGKKTIWRDYSPFNVTKPGLQT